MSDRLSDERLAELRAKEPVSFEEFCMVLDEVQEARKRIAELEAKHNAHWRADGHCHAEYEERKRIAELEKRCELLDAERTGFRLRAEELEAELRKQIDAREAQLDAREALEAERDRARETARIHVDERVAREAQLAEMRKLAIRLAVQLCPDDVDDFDDLFDEFDIPKPETTP